MQHGLDLLCPDCPHVGEEAQDTVRPRRRPKTPEQVEAVREAAIGRARKAKAERLVAHLRPQHLTAGQVSKWNQQRWIAVAKDAKENFPSPITQALVVELLEREKVAS